jgi:hypothetical protein
MRVTHDDDVSDLENLNRKLQGRRNAVRQPARIIGRHKVGDVANDENFARMAVENHFRRDARIAAADQHDVRPLAGGGQPLEAAAFQRQAGLDEGPIAFGQSIRQPHSTTRGGTVSALPSMTIRYSRKCVAGDLNSHVTTEREEPRQHRKIAPISIRNKRLLADGPASGRACTTVS